MRKELESKALALALEGKTISKITAELGITRQSLWDYRNANIPFSDNFARALAEGMEELADSLLDIVDLQPDVQKAKVQSDNIKFILSKRKPQVYGDRVDINVKQTIDIGGALREARQRAMLPLSDSATDPIAQAIDVTSTIKEDATGSKPVTKDADQKSSDDIFS